MAGKKKIVAAGELSVLSAFTSEDERQQRQPFCVRYAAGHMFANCIVVWCFVWDICTDRAPPVRAGR